MTTDTTSDFDIKFDYFEKVKSENKFKSVWSIFEVINIFELSGLEGNTLVYEDHWGDKPVEIPLPGGNLSWWGLWSAGDKAIAQSGDQHHIFIEMFVKKGNNIYLRTGS